MAAPAFADPAQPTAAELRRRAIWGNWRGIADLSPTGGYGQAYGSVASVPGREYSALAKVPGAAQPHRVLVQVPDHFDTRRRCIVVTASSGSRGIYGAIAVAAPWGLPKGCAVAYTDKGAGTDYFDLDAQQGAREDGTVGALGTDALAFAPDDRSLAVMLEENLLLGQPSQGYGNHPLGGRGPLAFSVRGNPACARRGRRTASACLRPSARRSPS